eukprot:308690-Prymnesium_polylepis.1
MRNASSPRSSASMSSDAGCTPPVALLRRSGRNELPPAWFSSMRARASAASNAGIAATSSTSASTAASI